MKKKCKSCGKEFETKEKSHMLCYSCWKEEREYTEYMAEYEHDDWGDRD